MKRFLPGPLPDHARNLMRRIGYGEQRTKSGQISYVRRVYGERFPRYHAYVEERDGGLIVNLHVDQKEASYQGTHAHGGEYEGPVVEKEMMRIISSISQLSRLPDQPSQAKQETPKKKGFWQILSGR